MQFKKICAQHYDNERFYLSGRGGIQTAKKALCMLSSGYLLIRLFT